MIYILSGSGAPNYGDELILAMWIRFLKSVGRCDNVVVNTHIPANTERDHCFKSHGVRIQSDLWSLAKKATEGMTFKDALEAGKGVFNNTELIKAEAPRFESDVSAIKIFHIHGGGYISTNNSRSAFLLGVGFALARRYGVKVFGTGLGVEPFELRKVNINSLAEVLECFEFFECRDNVGAAKFLSVLNNPQKIISGLDDNFLEEPKVHDSVERRASGAIHLSFSWPLPKLCKENFFESVKRLRSQFESLIVWQSYPWNEKETIINLIHKLGACEVFSSQELFVNGAPVKKGDLMFAYKFHPHFIAARLQAGGYFISNSEYYDVKHESIVRLGSPFERFSGAFDISHLQNRRNMLVENDSKHVRAKRLLAGSIYA